MACSSPCRSLTESGRFEAGGVFTWLSTAHGYNITFGAWEASEIIHPWVGSLPYASRIPSLVFAERCNRKGGLGILIDRGKDE